MALLKLKDNNGKEIRYPNVQINTEIRTIIPEVGEDRIQVFGPLPKTTVNLVSLYAARESHCLVKIFAVRIQESKGL